MAVAIAKREMEKDARTGTMTDSMAVKLDAIQE